MPTGVTRWGLAMQDVGKSRVLWSHIHLHWPWLRSLKNSKKYEDLEKWEAVYSTPFQEKINISEVKYEKFRLVLTKDQAQSFCV